MADMVGNVAGTGVVTMSRAASAAPSVEASSNQTSFDAALNDTSGSGVVTPALARHVEVDPMYGLVTRYVNTEGNIVSQVPSTFALTYLRAGLVTGPAVGGESGGEVVA